MVHTPQKCWGKSRGLARLLSSGTAGHAAHHDMLHADIMWPCYKVQCEGKVIQDVELVPHPRSHAWALKVTWKTKKAAGDLKKVYESVHTACYKSIWKRENKTDSYSRDCNVTEVWGMNSDNLPQITRTTMWDWRPVICNVVPGSLFPPYSCDKAV